MFIWAKKNYCSINNRYNYNFCFVLIWEIVCFWIPGKSDNLENPKKLFPGKWEKTKASDKKFSICDTFVQNTQSKIAHTSKVKAYDRNSGLLT